MRNETTMQTTDDNQNTQLVTLSSDPFAPAKTSTDWDLAGKVAVMCRAFIDATAVNIQGKRYIPVEGWQSIAAAWGYTPSTEEPYKTPNGYRCKAQLKRDSDGAVISEAYGYVGDDEIWKDRAQYANEAMVQTRAISRVCRNKFAFVAVLMKIEGLATTPAEEVPEGGFRDRASRPVDDTPATVKLHDIVEGTKAKPGKGRDGRPDGSTLYECTMNGRYMWTKDSDTGKQLLAADGLEIIAELKPGSKPNIYQLLAVHIPQQADLKQEPDDIPF